MPNIFKSLHGREFGLGPNNELIVNHTRKAKPANCEAVVDAIANVTITSAQLLALNATPITVIAAPGAGLFTIVRQWMAYKPAGTAYAGIASGEDISLKYTNGSGANLTPFLECTGFLDQTTAQVRYVGGYASIAGFNGTIIPVANAAVVAHMLTGEITTGDTDLLLRIWYDVLPSTLS